jgi:hypothetical protein
VAKIGRNQPCPCGSGKKYKRCHGAPVDRKNVDHGRVGQDQRRADAERVQRERQQGLGKPIISADFGGQRLVAVKNRLLKSKRWATFEDFLFDYIKVAMGSEWGNAELAKPIEMRHPVLTWYQKACDYLRKFGEESGKVRAAPATGAVAAYLHLAWDLFALDHNAELQDKLRGRLRNHDNFAGARYEVYVAATFIRAGFNIEFENEDDRTTSHCEFSATYRRTGKSFSVEAKRSEHKRNRLGHLFHNALSKHANHPRVVFIDINTPDEASGEKRPNYLGKALARVRSFEGELRNGQPHPPAYVFVTNTPWEHYLDLPAPRCTFLPEGFRIPDFKSGILATLRGAIDARERHVEMHALIESIRDHSDVPSTFDGEIPEYAFNPDLQRILIGEHYLVPDQDGIERLAELTKVTVAESERIAYCGLTFQDGHSAIYTRPLSDDEVAAWRRHPDTFCGVVEQRSTDASTPIRLYDFLYASFKQESKARLLEVMADHADAKELAELDQEELASVHAERTTHAAFAMQRKKTTP